jgi:hypothetical protein
MHEQTVSEAPKHPHHPHGLGLAHPALVLQVLTHAQSAALGLAQAFGELGPFFLVPGGGAAEMGQQPDGHQTPQGINADAGAVVGQALELFDQRTDWRGTLRAARAGCGLDTRQRGFEFFGLETAPDMAAQFTGEEAFGFLVRYVRITAHAAKAIGLTQFLPAVSSVNRAAKRFGINEGFDPHDGMALAACRT